MIINQQQSQTPIIGLVATIVPNAATGSELVLQQGTIITTIRISEIVNAINEQLTAEQEKKKNEDQAKQSEGSDNQALPGSGSEVKSNADTDGSPLNRSESQSS